MLTPQHLDSYAAMMLDLAEAMRTHRTKSPLSAVDVREHMRAIEAAGDPLGIVDRLREGFNRPTH